MFKSIWDDVIHYFRNGNMVAKIILVNIAIFIGVSLLSLSMNVGSGFSHNPTFNRFIEFFAVPSTFKQLLFHPWSVFSAIFLHSEFGHIFWNMLWLYFFGRIAGDLLNDRRMLPIYVMGGIFGALMFVISSEIIGLIEPSQKLGYSVGASGAVMAITVAAGVIAPDYRVSMILFQTRLKYVVAVLVFLDVLGASAITSGRIDHFAHLGGAFFGWFFIYLLKKGTDLSVPFNSIIDRMKAVLQGQFIERKLRPKPKVAYKNEEKIKKRRLQPNRQTDYGSTQERIDDILDKIKKKGMKSLSQEEIDFLNHHSNQLD